MMFSDEINSMTDLNGNKEIFTEGIDENLFCSVQQSILIKKRNQISFFTMDLDGLLSVV